MRKIVNRVEKLEKVFHRVAASTTTWDSMAKFRDRLLLLAEQRDASSVAALREELERLGPAVLLRETARGYLSDRGFVQSESESFPQTMARALGITTDELRVCIAENRNWFGVTGEVRGA